MLGRATLTDEPRKGVMNALIVATNIATPRPSVLSAWRTINPPANERGVGTAPPAPQTWGALDGVEGRCAGGGWSSCGLPNIHCVPCGTAIEAEHSALSSRHAA